MLKDQFIPPPFGESRASWIINGEPYRRRLDAEIAARELGFNAHDACDYVSMLMEEYQERIQILGLTRRTPLNLSR